MSDFPTPASSVRSAAATTWVMMSRAVAGNLILKTILNRSSPQGPILGNLLGIEIGPERSRHFHTSIGPLVVFDDRHPSPADCQPAAIQSVDKLGLTFSAFESDIRAARLEGFEIRARGDLLELIQPRQPYLDVVGFGGRESHIACRQHDRSER